MCELFESVIESRAVKGLFIYKMFYLITQLIGEENVFELMTFITLFVYLGIIIVTHLLKICQLFFAFLKRTVSGRGHQSSENITQMGPPLYLNGLNNMGNTCYMNSSLQALYSIDEFRDYMIRGKCRKPLHQSLSELFKTLNKQRRGESVDPIDFINTFVKIRPEFGNGRQHDAQEFLRFLIDELHEECKAMKNHERRGNDTLKSLFMGKFKSIVKCSQCGKQSNSLEEFWDISLAIPQTEDECDLEECFQNYTKPEILDTKSDCDKCKEVTQFSKELNFEVLPQILMIHLKKFGNDGQKISKEVKISSNIAIKSIDYSLVAFISHRGMNSWSGHYISYCGYINQCYRCDDHKISLVNEISSTDVSNAYILFFKRSD